jgi:capsular exopolysaccharide synthesis family protein
MSKIFEALSRLEDSGKEPLAPELAASGLTIEPLSAESVSIGQTAPAALPVSSRALDPPTDAPIREEQAVPGKAAQTAPVTTIDEAAEIRVLPLRVPLSAPVFPYDGAAQDSTVSERYRIIRTKILHHPRQPRVMVVSSPGAGDGKTVTAVNLAGALSLKANAKVLLMDADFRRPTIHKQTGLPNDPGLAGVLEKQCSIRQALIHTLQFPNLYVLPAGEWSLNPAELLDSAEWHYFLTRIREMFAYVVIDSPPMTAVADYDLIQARSDGVILVTRPDHTKRAACFRALEMIPGEKMLGVVVNCVEDWFLGRALRQDNYYYYETGQGR